MSGDYINRQELRIAIRDLSASVDGKDVKFACGRMFRFRAIQRMVKRPEARKVEPLEFKWWEVAP